MTRSAQRIGILTSGGDCPGLNAVLRAAALAAESHRLELLGIHEGFEGLLPPVSHTILDRAATDGIMALGGTILGTVNRGRFNRRVGATGRQAIPAEVVGQARRTLEELGIGGLIVVGGDGSLSTALQLHHAGIPVVGVPKTIDNDLDATSTTFGFDSAVECVADSIDRLRATASSHKRVMILEVMGRHTGWIALHGGIAGAADIILLPEIPFDHDVLAATIERHADAGHKSTIIVVAEGAAPVDGRQRRVRTGSGEQKLGGIAESIGAELGRRIDREIRTCVLGHLQRGGAPTMLDRNIATCFGVKAVDLVREGAFGMMTARRDDRTTAVPLEEAVRRRKQVGPECEILAAARALGISFGERPRG
jgi:ATP-dependent phosphofructokinase / diphosphate-dependent phosphofructokinase